MDEKKGDKKRTKSKDRDCSYFLEDFLKDDLFTHITRGEWG